jgi:hypothetical protein
VGIFQAAKALKSVDILPVCPYLSITLPAQLRQSSLLLVAVLFQDFGIAIANLFDLVFVLLQTNSIAN